MLAPGVAHAEPPWPAPSAGRLAGGKGSADSGRSSNRLLVAGVPLGGPARDVEARDDREPEPEATRPCPGRQDRRVLHRRPAAAGRRAQVDHGGGGAAAAAPRPRRRRSGQDQRRRRPGPDAAGPRPRRPAGAFPRRRTDLTGEAGHVQYRAGRDRAGRLGPRRLGRPGPGAGRGGPAGRPARPVDRGRRHPSLRGRLSAEQLPVRHLQPGPASAATTSACCRRPSPRSCTRPGTAR